MSDQNIPGGQADQQTTETQNEHGKPDADLNADLGAGDAGDGGSGGGADDAELQALREKLAGGDEAMLRQLSRYKSVDGISKQFREAYHKAKNGAKPVALTDKSTPEEVKAFREANGIPEDAAAYPGDFREGFTPTDADKAILGEFKAAMHGKNVPPAAAAAALDWYQDFAQAQQQELNANLAKVAKETQTALRTEWGGEYDGNIGAAQQIMTQHLGKEGFEDMMELRLMDGSRLQDHAGFVKMMANIGVDYFGGNAIMNGDVETVGKTIQGQIDDLLKMRLDDPEKYKSDAVQEKLTKLYAQRDKLDARKG